MASETKTSTLDNGNRIIETNDSHSADRILARRLTYKCDLRLLPPLLLLWFFPFIDRVNIGNARIQGLETDLHMVGNQFNAALVVFFIPLILVEAPSNLGMKSISPSVWLGSATTLLGKS